MGKKPKAYQPKNPFTRWLDERLPLPRWLYENICSFSIPRNLNYFYSFGAILTLLLFLQILSGLILAMHYVPDVNLAFASREHFAREGHFGWLFTSWHRIGASFFFLAAYIHMARGLYYGSYKGKRELVWLFGIILYFLLLLTAFFGYVLSWGAMSVAAATVISSLLGEIPLFGPILVKLFLGDDALGQAALNRFYIWHGVLPMLLLAFVVLHIWAVHKRGSTNPSGRPARRSYEKMAFAPYMLLKDILAAIVFLLFFAWFLFYMPDYMGEPDNFMAANSQNLPLHIRPPWYFLPFYSMLRAVSFSSAELSSGFFGLLLIILAWLALVLVPWLDRSKAPSARFRPIYRFCYWLFIFDFALLGWLATQELSDNIAFYSKWAIAYYFAFFFVILPFLPRFEKLKPLPASLWQDYQKSRKRKKLW